MRRITRVIAGLLVVVVGGMVLPSCQVVGKGEVGWYRQGDSSFHLRWPDGTSMPFVFGEGASGTFPIAGDWGGVGRSLVGWYRQSDSSFHIQQPDGTSNPFVYGDGGSTNFPFAGDWNGDGKDQVGFYRQSDGSFHLRKLDGGSQAFVYGDGGPGTYPVAGDWNGDDRDEVGFYRQSDGSFHLRKHDGTSVAFTYGDGGSNTFPFTVDHDGDGKDEVGFYRQSDGSFHIRRQDATSIAFSYGGGGAGTYPIGGNWDGDKPPANVPQAVTIGDIEAIWGPIGSTRATVIAGLPSLNDAMVQAGITTPARKAAFLATIRHESGFRYNAVEGGTATYRGRGFIQLTNDFNYGPAGQWLNYNLLADPAAAATLAYSAPIARWYWTVARQINPMADALDMAAVNVAIGYAPSAAEDAARCEDFKAALRYFNGGTLPGGINCVRGATALSQEVEATYADTPPKGPGVG